jgi:hypothetical protein
MLRLFNVHLAAICCLMAACLPSLAQESFGRFNGDVIVRFLPDGRTMKLERPFSYVDPKGRAWDVPTGTETDGASIPRVLWITHPPFTGQYRTAAVVHDHMCQTKKVGWKETHEIFYSAMRAAGVTEPIAKAMYGAVYYYGPRWGIGVASRGPGAGLSNERQEEVLEDMREWIARENPSLEEIARRADQGGRFDRRT